MARDADATEELRLERSLFASIDQSPMATVITNPRLHDNPIMALNEAFCQLTGYHKDEVLGRNCRLLAGRGSEPGAKAVLREAVKQGRAALAELTNYKKDGTAFRNAVMIAPILSSDGALAYFLGSQMELTKQSAPVATPQSADRVKRLTPRQFQVLQHMVHGLRNKQIAALLGIDEKTVKMHRAGLLAKLRAATSADAIRIGVEAGL